MTHLKKTLIIFSIWWIGAIFTYGHAVKQFGAECEAKEMRYCMGRIDAFGASLFWPMHWSEAVWK